LRSRRHSRALHEIVSLEPAPLPTTVTSSSIRSR
jgi:hypothetical protein